MQQSNTGPNNVQIGSVSGGATVTVRQSAPATAPQSVDLDRHATLVGNVSKRESRVWGISAIVTLFIPVLSVVADVSGVFGTFKLPIELIFPTCLVLLTIIAAAKWNELSLGLESRRASGDWIPLGHGRAARRQDGNRLPVYRFDAPCTYNRCQGRIELATPPERERGKYFLAARCTIGKWMHGYSVDPNLTAHPQPMDPRRAEHNAPAV